MVRIMTFPFFFLNILTKSASYCMLHFKVFKYLQKLKLEIKTKNQQIIPDKNRYATKSYLYYRIYTLRKDLF